jgi:hypothetical protein
MIPQTPLSLRPLNGGLDTERVKGTILIGVEKRSGEQGNMKVNRIVSWAAVGLFVALVPLGIVVNASRAQDTPAMQSETLEQKVARLDKEVAELKSLVRELQQRSPNLYVIPQSNRGALTSGLPRGAKPFTFNDRTYYIVPLNEESKPAVSVAPAKGVEQPRMPTPATP